MLKNNSPTFKKFQRVLKSNSVTANLTCVKLYEKDGESKQSKTGCQDCLTFAQQELNTYSIQLLSD